MQVLAALENAASPYDPGAQHTDLIPAGPPVAPSPGDPDQKGRTLRVTPETPWDSGEPLIITKGSTLKGTGHVQGQVINHGLLAPGNSPGILVFEDSMVQDGTVLIEIAGLGGAGAADGHDLIQVANEASLNGRLQVDLLDGYLPEVGDRFTFLTSGSLDGQFVSGGGFWGFGDGTLFWEIEQVGNRLDLVATAVSSSSGSEAVLQFA